MTLLRFLAAKIKYILLEAPTSQNDSFFGVWPLKSNIKNKNNFLNSNNKNLFKFVYVRQIFVQNVKKQGVDIVQKK
ncbi:hypothetical protein BpHYR1_022755 [Brachionus plicatilis]|uniref:Uncharacterized protein n=1 Tax=Brachionus plicatilis TaxID=10195 RepID=A0A3M7TB37_BRAPC|nr:hypothetical protein BpHYR1_022755 [Brachionus plicatilis]